MIFKGVMLSSIMFVGTIVLFPWLVCRIPECYFLHQPSKPSSHPSPFLKGFRRLIRNIAGFFLVLVGIIMLFVPGQGLLTILLGIILIDFPGKRLLEEKLIGIESLRNTLNWIRRKNNVKELRFP
jgi:hypothetical protein